MLGPFTWERGLGLHATTTDGAGGFELRGFAPEPCHLVVEDGRESWRRLELSLPARRPEPLELVLERRPADGATLQLIVTDSHSGAPVSRYTAHLMEPIAPGMQLYRRRHLCRDPQGRLQLEGVDPGVWGLRVEGPGYAPYQSQWQLGSGRQEIAVALDPTATVCCASPTCPPPG